MSPANGHAHAFGQRYDQNFAATFVWVIWWVGMTYVVTLIGNVWDMANPWRVLYAVTARSCLSE